MGDFGRPPSPSFTKTQAVSLRRIFRTQRGIIGASNADIGKAIDDFGLAGKADGLTVLQNSLSPARKLTHRTARIVVAGLFLADRTREASFENAFDLAFAKRKAALTSLGGAMYAYHAWGGHSTIPAFIPLEAIDRLAVQLAPGRPALRKMLSQKLRAEAPAMARAWCERVRRTPIAGNTPQIIEFIGRIEKLVRAEFPESDAERHGLMFSLGSEFDIVHRERPDLTEDFLRELARAHSIDARSNP